MVDALESQTPLSIAGFGEGRQYHATSLGAPQLPNLTSFQICRAQNPDSFQWRGYQLTKS